MSLLNCVQWYNGALHFFLSALSDQFLMVLAFALQNIYLLIYEVVYRLGENPLMSV